MEAFVKFKMRYGGNFIANSDIEYVGGITEVITVDCDKVSCVEFKKLVEEAGYTNVIALYYKFPQAHIASRQRLENDGDVLKMMETINDGDLMEIYVEHAMETNGATGAIVLARDVEFSSLSEIPPTVEGRYADDKVIDDECVLAETRVHDELTDFSDEEIERDKEDLFCGPDEDMEQVRINFSQSLKSVFSTEKESECPDGKIDDADYIPSDDLLSDNESSGDEDGVRRYKWFNEKTDFGPMIELTVGLQFRDAIIFRSALRDFAIRNGFNFDYINNKSNKINAQCRNENCPWRISASNQVDKNGGVCFQIKLLHPHDKNCRRNFASTKITAKYLATHYLEAFRDNPKWEIEAFQLHVRREFQIDVSYKKCWRAKTKALTIIEGSVGEQYKLLKDYCAALRVWNPGTSVYLTTDGDHFQRIYICLDACKRGFLAGCRPLISLDACHLKGAYNGQIHAAVGRDGNDNMFPIAYAICESESKDTWHWFLQNLLMDIGNSRSDGWCFISDQQKGLQEALKELYPNSEHRFCVRHLYANFCKVFKGKQLKDAMWACARASTLAQFQRAMEYVKSLDKDAHTYLSKLNPAVWSRHGFTSFVKSDALCSNISECFNSFIRKARDQPIITCLEIIRKLLMKRFYEKRTGIENYMNDICPRILKKLEDKNKVSVHCNVTYGGGNLMEVEHTIHGTYVVNVYERSCTCRLWDLTGIPCSHACAAIRHMRGDPSDYVHQSYRKSEFKRTYESYILPLPGPSEWPQQEGQLVLPPLFRRQAGRPRRRRIREANEPINVHKKRKGGSTMTCSRCGSAGHNARRCKGDIVDPKKVEQRKKDAARAARNRMKKKQATTEVSQSPNQENESRDGGRKFKKASVKRKNRSQDPFIINESQVSTKEYPSRNWHSEYDIIGNAVPYERPILNGPLQISVRGGQAMFRRGTEGPSSKDLQNDSNIQDK